jgi:YidC/Oxa1 family membrane protein insertase
MDFLTNPFTTALLFLYQFLGQNIVLTIVVFTVLIRLATYPLTYQQIKSSKAMQELQPKLKKLQEKHKGDREKMAQAQMELYREHGVNPLAGCLPLVIQLPILLGLYGAISRSLAATPLQLLDLHHRILIPGLSHLVPLQNQFLWLNLAAPDPYLVLPILVVATTWLQQKLMTPTPTGSADPKDPSAAMARNMTVMMPLMIGIFSLQFASGLSIYWVVSNLAGILQYAMLGKIDFRTLLPGRSGAPTLVVEEVDDTPKTKALPERSDNGAQQKLRAQQAKKRKSGTSKTKASKAK